MARSILANSSASLNLSRRQIELFQQILITGKNMSEMMIAADYYNYNNNRLSVSDNKNKAKLRRKWSDLMVELAKTLL